MFLKFTRKSDRKYKDYDITTMYNSGNKSHFSDFNNIDNESVLQNVFMHYKETNVLYTFLIQQVNFIMNINQHTNINNDIEIIGCLVTEFNSHDPNYSDKIGSDYFNNSILI